MNEVKMSWYEMATKWKGWAGSTDVLASCWPWSPKLKNKFQTNNEGFNFIPSPVAALLTVCFWNPARDETQQLDAKGKQCWMYPGSAARILAAGISGNINHFAGVRVSEINLTCKKNKQNYLCISYLYIKLDWCNKSGQI